MRPIFKLAYPLFAVIFAATLGGCSSGGSSTVASGPPPEQPNIVVDAVPTADEAGLYIAQDDGFFAQQGLHVTIRAINGGEYGMADLQDGKAEIVAGNYVSFILAQIAGKYPAGTPQARSISMRIIADGSQMQPGNQALYVLPTSRIKTVADMAKYHATVGINSIDNIGQVLLGSLFQEEGLNLSKDVTQVVPPTGFPGLLTDLATGKIDVAWLPEPFGTIAEETFGAVELADFDQGALQDFPIGAYIGTTQWVQTHPNTVAAFLRALQQGQQIADTDRAAVETALEGLPAPYNVSKVVAATMTIDTYPLVMDVPVMQRVADAMYQYGVISKPYNIINMIQPEPGMINSSS